MGAAQLRILETAQELAVEAARRLTRAAAAASPPFRLALAGGSTPLRTYQLLAADPRTFPVPWRSVQVFWGDERFVPRDDPRSNYRAASEALLDLLPEPPAGVFPVPTDAGSPVAAARRYDRTLAQAFDLATGRTPRFDLVLLGLGVDGHTASLFPGAVPVDAGRRLVVAVEGEGIDPPRISMTTRVLCAAREVLFLISGPEKAEVLHRVLQARTPDPALPATWIRPGRGRLHFLADRAAAARCTGGEQRR